MTDEHDEAGTGSLPPLLDYRAPRDEPRQWPAWAQATVGFVLAGGTSAVLNFVGGIFISFNPTSRPDTRPVGLRILIASGIVLAPLLYFGGIGIGMRRRGRWPAFLPGVLAGWGVAALVEGACFLSLLK